MVLVYSMQTDSIDEQNKTYSVCVCHCSFVNIIKEFGNKCNQETLLVWSYHIASPVSKFYLKSVCFFKETLYTF